MISHDRARTNSHVIELVYGKIVGTPPPHIFHGENHGFRLRCSRTNQSNDHDIEFIPFNFHLNSQENPMKVPSFFFSKSHQSPMFKSHWPIIKQPSKSWGLPAPFQEGLLGVEGSNRICRMASIDFPDAQSSSEQFQARDGSQDPRWGRRIWLVNLCKFLDMMIYFLIWPLTRMAKSRFGMIWHDLASVKLVAFPCFSVMVLWFWDGSKGKDAEAVGNSRRSSRWRSTTVWGMRYVSWCFSKDPRPMICQSESCWCHRCDSRPFQSKQDGLAGIDFAMWKLAEATRRQLFSASQGPFFKALIWIWAVLKTVGLMIKL